jgi:integrase
VAYIRKLASGWRAEVQKHGSRVSKVLPTKREAQAWALEQEAKAGSLSKGWRTFDEAAIKYEKEVSVKKDGKVWEARRLGVMRDHFAGKPLGAIDAPDIAAWRDWRLQTVSGSTVLRETNLLKHIFHTARDEWRWMEHDPFRGVKLPKENAPRTALWGWREIRRVLRAGQQSGGKTAEVAVAFHISLRTAMRLKECLAAPQHYDAKARTVTLTDTKTGRRVIPVGRIAGKLLERPAFVVQPNEASTLFAKLTKRLMIDGLTFHDGRATALTHLARRVDVLTLARVSGHRDIALLNSVYYRESSADVALRLR